MTTAIAADNFTTLPADSNQALGIAEYAIDFMKGRLGDGPAPSVWQRTEQFHTDSVFCGISALALGCNAPTVLRNEALDYPANTNEKGACVFGSTERVKPEKAVVANSCAVREWDSNGTNFGYNPALNHTAGEFGHNDFYPVVVAACQELNLDGRTALRAMILVDEIRGRLAEVFSLKSYKIDHVVHGAIASAAVYGALHGATAQQIESAIGMVVAHYIPWRAIRAGKQLSDSKGASAAISSEVAVLSMKRAMKGFLGPRDIFRNPEAIFRFFEPTSTGNERWKEMSPAPFDLVLAHSGEDFAVMGMHFKLGLYEHQSAGAIQGIIDLVAKNPSLLADAGKSIARIEIAAYEPAFGIIGNPSKMNPTTRQSADHSMAYIIATLLRKAIEFSAKSGPLPIAGGANDGIWKAIMLSPYDYKEDDSALNHPLTRALMQKIAFRHGGAEYDAKYPDGIPTSLTITDASGNKHDSGFVMYPAGHARNTTADLNDILDHKFRLLAGLAVKNPESALKQLTNLTAKPAADIQKMYEFDIEVRGGFA
ncbi:MAG: MmgE/PrpD family protein [Phycisphaeraceae bacterium]|nr:MmgE/PrpD family protein [Phycisphaerales bacterium]MCB9844093.1 MmgE/PrpD family protein [Phycisphaeraceae bacterium]